MYILTSSGSIAKFLYVPIAVFYFLYYEFEVIQPCNTAFLFDDLVSEEKEKCNC